MLFLNIALQMKALEPGTAAVLLAIGVLLVCSAAMSASEVALFSLSPTQLRDVQERGGTSGQRVMDLLAKPRRLLATILIANNFVNVAIIILSTVAVADLGVALDLSAFPALADPALQGRNLRLLGAALRTD